MKKYFILMVAILTLAISNLCMAAQVSNDKMLAEWTTTKVWMVGDELCARGRFENKQSDFLITKLNQVEMKFVFTREDGSVYVYTANPKKIPFCKVPPRSSKDLTLNFGKFSDTWKKWVTTAYCEFTYQQNVGW